MVKEMVKEKDNRYMRLKQLILHGDIHTLAEIFEIVPKTTVARDMKISLDRFDRKVKEIERFSLREFFKLTALLEVDEIAVFKLFVADVQARKPKKKKSSQ
jgi:hypothetical protein